MAKRRIAWMTDLHLEFLLPWEVETFFEEIEKCKADAVMITGDISQSKSLRSHLLQMANYLDVPVYFVLGNHDCYHSDIPIIREEMTKLTREKLGPVWLPEVGIVELTPEVGLVGHDGWADGRYGDFLASPVVLNDYLLIKSLRLANSQDRLDRLRELGDEAAAYIRRILTEAVNQYKQIFILMHAPPFQESCWHEGKTPSDNDPHLPHFSCKAIGDVLSEIARAHPDHDFTVLCGHTHGGGRAQILDNLLVHTGAAEYGKPVVNHVFELE